LLRDGAKKLIAKYPEYKGLLIIIDDLDKVTPSTADHLFFDYGYQLQQLDCNIIYTVPISIIYSTKNIENIFEERAHLLPMVNIYHFDQQAIDLEYTPEGLEAMTSVIAKRVNVDLVFASQAELQEIAKASGGHVRQLIKIMRTACQNAIVNKHSQINMTDVEYGIRQEQFKFERIIPEEHYAFLAEVCVSKNLTKTEKTQEMLYNLSVLEYIYMMKRRWNYVNPVVKNIELFQQALQEV
jgi:Cdc6-like AAA superfamily ATPase